MEEKLNKIYQKLLDIETRIKIIEYDRELKEAEAEEKNVKYKIEDIKNGSHYIREQAEEEMAMFRRIKEEE